MKKCGRCKQSKDKAAFAIGSKNKDGLQNWCKECHIEYRRLNQEKFRAANARWYANNKEYRAEYYREYYQRRKAAGWKR